MCTGYGGVLEIPLNYDDINFKFDTSYHRILLDAGADLESDDKWGWTALVNAAIEGQNDVIRLVDLNMHRPSLVNGYLLT